MRAGRRINDGMAKHVADETVKLMLRKGISVVDSQVLVLGLTFKENCPGVRNTKVVDIVKHLQAYNTRVDVYDPWIDPAEAKHEYGLTCLTKAPAPGQYEAIVVAMGHRQFIELGPDGIKAWGRPGAVVYDVKSVLPMGSVPRSLAGPITTNETNISGFLNMLVAARDAQMRSLTYAASNSTYSDHPALPKVEENIGNPLSPYAVTKHVNELYASVFARSYGFKAIGLLYFNVFGPRQDPNGAYAAVIPKWTAALLKGETVFINGDGETSRYFCYVANAVQADLLAATTTEEAARNQVYNVADGDRTTLNQLYAWLQKALAQLGLERPTTPEYRGFREGDVRHSQADVSKARDMMGYRPLYTIRQGLSVAIPWYRGRQIVNLRLVQ